MPILNKALTLPVALFLLVYVGAAQRVYSWEATIERDIWGVPHVHGKTDADAAFGLGYAMAEDTWQVIENSIPYYRGTAGRYFGPDAAKQDYLVHWLGLWNDIDARYESDLTPATRAYIEAFAAGLNRYVEDNPSASTLDLAPITGQDIVAAHMLRHLLFYGFDAAVGELVKEQRARGISEVPSPAGTVIRDGVPTGSNAIAVAPSRSADGSTMLIINSHQPLTGPVAWYEAHIESDEGLNVMGGLFPGAPTMGVGFTPTTAWGATVNKPDLVDTYVLDMNPDNPDQYRLDGQWKTLEAFDIELDVLIWGFIPWSVTERGYRSEHGPVMKTPHGTYAIRYAGMGELRQVEQWLAMNKASNFSEWHAALTLNHIQSFNFIYAGQAGNIYFVHNSEMPDRLPGWDWQQYLPGDRSELIWRDYIEYDRLPQIKNPPSGFILSTNQSPFRISAEGSNPAPQDSPATGGWQTRMTNRAERGLELFQQYPRVSPEDLLTIKHDNRYSEGYRGIEFLRRVLAVSADEPRIGEAQTILQRWNLATDKDNREAALGVCILKAEWNAEARGLQLPDPKDTLATCVDELDDMTGSITPTWGSVNRHGRDDIHYPMAGGPDTLRASYATADKTGDFNRVTAGDGLYYLVRWDANGEQSILGVHQYGNHFDNPENPHYHDQAKDFSDEVLHPALFQRAVRESSVKRSNRIISSAIPEK